MTNDNKKHDFNLGKVYIIFIIIVIILFLLNKYFNIFKDSGFYKSILFIYIGSIFYIVAAFYHLSIRDWTFLTAAAIAVPILILEYTFSLRGNRFANKYLSATKILILTMIFYLINLTILDTVILQNGVSYRDIISLFLIIAAVYVSGIADRIMEKTK